MVTTLETCLHLFVDRLTTRSILSDEEQQAILGLPTHVIQLAKKRDFVAIDERRSYAWLIASGMVGRFGQTDDGARQITAFYVPGDMVDLSSTVRPVGNGGLTALCATTILRVPNTALQALAARFPAIADALWRDCMLDAAILMQWLVNVGRRDARTRLAHIFCEMAIRSGDSREAQHDYDFPITQEQLGDAAALTPVHVNRSLGTLAKLVTLKNGRAHIHDWPALAGAGQFDSGYLVADTLPERQKWPLAAAKRNGRFPVQSDIPTGTSAVR